MASIHAPSASAAPGLTNDFEGLRKVLKDVCVFVCPRGSMLPDGYARSDLRDALDQQDPCIRAHVSLEQPWSFHFQACSRTALGPYASCTFSCKIFGSPMLFEEVQASG